MSNLVKSEETNYTSSIISLRKCLKGNPFANGEIPVVALAETSKLIQNTSIQLAVKDRDKTLAASIRMSSKEETIKMIAVAIASFQRLLSLNTMSVSVILETAGLIVEKYTHETYKDILVAFKESVMDGKKFYNSISAPLIFEIINTYLERKYEIVEREVIKEKNGYELSQDAVTDSYIKMMKGEWKLPKTMRDKAEENISAMRAAQVRYVQELLMKNDFEPINQPANEI